MRASRILVLFAAIGTLLLVAGCGPDIQEGGFRQSGGKRDWQAGFGAWDGTESHELGVAGNKSMRLTYRARLDEGTVTFVLRDSEGHSVWEIAAGAEPIDNTEELPLYTPGEYNMTAYGAGATGEFEFSWKVR